MQNFNRQNRPQLLAKEGSHLCVESVEIQEEAIKRGNAAVDIQHSSQIDTRNPTLYCGSRKGLLEKHGRSSSGMGMLNRGNTTCTHCLCCHALLVHVHITTVLKLETNKQQNSIGFHDLKGINVSPSSYDEYMA